MCIQTSVDSVEALIKKHSDFEGTSVAHEEKTKALSDQANRLIHAGHYATTRYTSQTHCNMLIRPHKAW